MSEGSLILLLEAAGANGGPPQAAPEAPAAAPAAAAAAAPPGASYDGDVDVQADVVVLGAGPGGYTAAFRAADLGLKTVLIERYESLGGVCLNVGCIPSKALLHMAKVLTEAEESAAHGIAFGKPEIDIDGLRGWKDSVVSQLTGGLVGLAKQRKVQVVHGTAQFASPNVLTVEGGDGTTAVGFQHCIIAAGSSATRLPGFPYDDPRLIDSTGALELADVPERLLVIGGGIIGLEMATVYDALGVEGDRRGVAGRAHPRLRQGPRAPAAQAHREALRGDPPQDASVTAIEATDEGLRATFEGDGAPEPQVYGRVLLAVGRRPNGASLAAEKAGVVVDERGFISVDRQMRTNVPHIFAIGDVVGEPMLAHKATHEGKVAAEVIAGHDVTFDAQTIPSVAYTDPEVAWMGLTETEAKDKGIAYEKGAFPWAASGRALSDRAPGRLDQAARRPGDAPHPRRGHRGRERRGADRRGCPCARDGRGRGGRRSIRPSASHAVRDDRLRRGGGRGHDHRPLHAQARKAGGGQRLTVCGAAPVLTGAVPCCPGRPARWGGAAPGRARRRPAARAGRSRPARPCAGGAGGPW